MITKIEFTVQEAGPFTFVTSSNIRTCTDIAALVPCGTCGAKVGDPCVKTRGSAKGQTASKPHDGRLSAGIYVFDAERETFCKAKGI